MDYHVRWSRSYCDLSGAISYVEKHAEELVVVEHESDEDVNRTHVHMYVKGLTCTKETLKNQFKKAFPGVTKSDYIHTTIYKDTHNDNVEKPIDKGLITYMSKGSLTPCLLKGVTLEEYTQYQTKWVNYQNNKYAKGNINRYVTIKEETPAQKKKRKWDLVNQMKKRYQANDNDWDYDNAVRIVVDVFTENELLISEYQVKDYVLTLMNHVNHNALISRLVKYCMPRL